MGFFIENLQFYLQADVLEERFIRLINSVNSSRDFETVLQSHSEFITGISEHFFLNTPFILTSLNDIMTHCLAFTALLIRIGAQQQQVNTFTIETLDENLPELVNIYKAFDRQRHLLFNLLPQLNLTPATTTAHSTTNTTATAATAATGHHQLLLRLNFNKNFDWQNSI